MSFLPAGLRPLASGLRRFLRPELTHKSRRTRNLVADFAASIPGLVVNIGSGTKEYGRNVLNVEIEPLSGVDVVGVAEQLPLRDGCCRGAILQAVLEHVRRADQTLSEARRVLAPGGALLVEIPFIQGFHAGPNDYRRFTEPGLREELERHGFVVEATGVAVGPASGMAWVTGEFLALLISGRSGTGYRFARLATHWLAWPIKLADAWLDGHRMAHVIASGVWALGRKPGCEDAAPLEPA